MRLNFLILGFIAATFFTANSFANARVGDFLQFKLTISEPENGTTVTQIESEVMSFNPAEDTYQIKETQTILLPQAQASTVEINEVDSDELLSFQEVARMLKDCTSLGGKKVKFTIAAGTFFGCHMDQNWFAQVPQGLARSVLLDPGTKFQSNLELQSYRFGK